MRDLNEFEQANLLKIKETIDRLFLNGDLPLVIITGNAERQSVGTIRIGDVSEKATEAALNAFVENYY